MTARRDGSGGGLYNGRMADTELDRLLRSLREHPGLKRKAAVADWARRFTAPPSGVIGPGDDAGAVPVDGKYFLLSGEGVFPDLLEDPEFAGFCAVTVNVNDIYAMGGRPVGVIAVVFAGGMTRRDRDSFLTGFSRGLEHYGIPMLGGHTSPEGERPTIAVCIAGVAERLLPGSGAKPGDAIVAALDLEGEPHHPFHAWDTVTGASGARTLGRLESLVEIANRGLATACRDISNPGLLGSLAMMLESSGAGASVDLDAVRVPPAVDLEWWLQAYPSYGFILCARPADLNALLGALEAHGVDCETIGEVQQGSAIEVRWKGETGTFLDWRERPVTGLF